MSDKVRDLLQWSLRNGWKHWGVENKLYFFNPLASPLRLLSTKHGTICRRAGELKLSGEFSSHLHRTKSRGKGTALLDILLGQLLDDRNLPRSSNWFIIINSLNQLLVSDGG